METMAIGRWTLSFDHEATRGACAQIRSGGSEECLCLPCKNFAAARQQVYPRGFQDFFTRVGIDLAKEAEVCHVCRLRPGIHLYNGLFHFVGRVEEGDDAWQPVEPGSEVRTPAFEKLGDGFSFGLSRSVGVLADSFAGGQAAQVEFMAEVPWVLEEPEPE